MRHFDTPRALVFCWTACFVGGAYPCALGRLAAQDPIIVEEDEQQNAAFNINVEQFDQWIFGSSRTGAAKKSTFDDQFEIKLDAIDRVCHLTEEQKLKIRLAGRGDIERFMEDVEVARAKFMLARNDRNEFNQIWQHIQPLQLRVQHGLFDETSLTHKVLQNTLDPKQASDYAQEELRRRQFQYEASVALAVTTLESGMPLRDEQREQFTALLANETEPPLKFGTQDYYVVMFKASQLPEAKLQPIFDTAQWNVLKRELAQGRNMERHFRSQGLIE